MAPLFDQGVSLLFSTYGDEKLLKETDVMRDFPVNNYIGSKSLEYNLSLIPKEYDLQIWKLKIEDQDYIFSGIDHALSEIHRNKIWEMIWKRWCFLNRYAIKRKNSNKIVGILNYGERTKKYTIDIPENVTPKETPFMMSLFLKKGIRTMNSDWSMRWVQSRIIPSSR